MAHHPSQHRNLDAPKSKPTTPNSDLIQTYKPSFLVKHMSSLNLAQTHKTRPPHKHSPLVDTNLQGKPMTTSVMVVPERESDVVVAVKRTHKEKSQKRSLELERRKLGDSNDKGVVEDAKVEKKKPGLEKHDGVERISLSLAPGGGGGGRRRSFCGSQADLRDVFALNGAKMVSVDMPPFMQIHAVNCARNALDSMEKFTSKTLALSLKKEFDGVYGPAWHCIVGTSFGSFVTHSVGGFLYFSMDQKLYILLFKTAVQKAG
ncbi:uncharacterized protein LOC124834650 isoform X1 [Vigna umbellata]|uniref:uncharacterized protein LOC124834650 isoform X1 n=1 Tax=Vigna umbellata TaxID=87088 RepID=UPI001F5E7CED|nr:uncharacterized protein LOC124834650 isoform X1 [Vigna umbellata]